MRAQALTGVLVLAFIAIGFTSAIVLQADGWPFSCTPMYSRVEVPIRWSGGRTAEGIPDGCDGCAPVPLTSAHVAPLTRFELKHALAAAAGAGRLLAAAAALLERYEQRRRAGLHAGPPLRRLDVYQHRYELDRAARLGAGAVERRLVQSAEAER